MEGVWQESMKEMDLASNNITDLSCRVIRWNVASYYIHSVIFCIKTKLLCAALTYSKSFIVHFYGIF